jgi:isopentenyl phosphate kinase
VVKLGGSAITVKNSFEVLNQPQIDVTASQVSGAISNGVKLAVLHGAGSFGHFQAKEYLISKGNTHPNWALGFAET